MSAIALGTGRISPGKQARAEDGRAPDGGAGLGSIRARAEREIRGSGISRGGKL